MANVVCKHRLRDARWLKPWITCILTSLFCAHSTLAYDATINSVSYTGGNDIIEADADNPGVLFQRDKVLFSVQTTFTRLASEPANATYIYRLQLLANGMDPVKLRSPGGAPVDFLTQQVAVNFGTANSVTITTNADFAPAEQVSAGVTHRLELQVAHLVAPGNFSLKDTRRSAARRLWHFRGTDSSPAANRRGVVARVSKIDWIKTEALATGDVPAQRAFTANVQIEVKRYFNWEAAAPGIDDVQFRLTTKLKTNDVPSQQIPLHAETNGIFDGGIAVPHFAFSSTIPGYREPSSQFYTLPISIRPQEQLETVLKQYFVAAGLEHVEFASTGNYQLDAAEFVSTTRPLLHFNGDLVAASTGATFLMQSFGSPATGDALHSSGNYRETTIFIKTGHLKSNANYTLAPIGGKGYSVPVRLFDDGRAEIGSAILPIIIPIAETTSPAPGNLTYTRTNMRFSDFVLRATVALHLPRGMGALVLGSQETKIALNTLIKQDHNIIPGLLSPFGPVTFTTGIPMSHFGLTEETKPFIIRCQNVVWNLASGQITPGPTPAGQDRVTYVRQFEQAALAAAPLPSNEKAIRSNEGYYARLAGTETGSAFAADENGHAGYSGTVHFNSGNVRTHFPYDGLISWNSASSISFIDDLPVPESASFTGANSVYLSHARDCGDANTCGGIAPALINLSVTDNPLSVTADGGLSVSGLLIQRRLEFGYIDALTSNPSSPVFAHRTSAFLNASFLSAGHFLSGKIYQDAGDDGPGILLNSGFAPAAPTSHTSAERPHTEEYAVGAADYPGLNYRVSGSRTAISYLGGLASPSYTLAQRSKYYARPSGVSGIHQPATNPFPSPVLIHDYLFEFSSYALSFLSSQVHDSRTRASVYIPDPASPSDGFEVALNPLFFSCIGALTTAEIDGGTFTHNLAYWNADIMGLSASFTPKAGAGCNPGSAFFTLGARGHLSNFDTPLYAQLLFHPNGDLVTAADPDCPPGFDSRFSPASNLRFAGPGGETYQLTPLHGAYLNTHAGAPTAAQGVGQGFMSIAGLLDVAFFRDLEVHIHTGARAENFTDPIHITAGWTENGGTFFDQSIFDAGNRGFSGAPTSLTEYRSAGNPSWRPHARQEWLGLVNFDYPLEWDTAARAFRSPTPLNDDFLVLKTSHQVRNLTAATAELDFGAGLDIRIPEINLAAIGPANPLFLVFDEIADAATSALLDGLDSSAGLLDDLGDEIFDRIFAATIDPIAEALAEAIAADAINIRLPSHFDAVLNPAFDALNDTLTLSTGVSAVLVDTVDTELARMQLAIRSLIGTIELNEDGIAIPTNPVLNLPEDFDLAAEITRPGLFFKEGSEENPEYLVARTLIRAVIDQIDPESAANLLLSLGSSALDEALNKALAKNAKAIEQIKINLMLVHNAIGEVRSRTVIASELANSIASSAADITAILQAARDTLNSELDLATLRERSVEELTRIIKDAIRQPFDASPIITRYHGIIRTHILELDAAMRSGMDSIFGQVNRIIADVFADSLPLDGPLNSMLGDLAGNSLVGNVDGYARIIGDSLRTLRLDADFEVSTPDAFSFNGYLEINQYQTTGTPPCGATASTASVADVRLGAENVRVNWLGSELGFDVGTKISFTSAGTPAGMAGSFELTGGKIEFEAFEIRELGAAAAFGLTENYLAAKAGLYFNGDRMYGGVFFGRTCSLDPLLLVDPDVAAVLPAPNPTFTGVYAYGEAFIPIINVGCLFKVSANAGAGIFAFAEDATVGGKMKIGADARALCAVNIGGDITLVGVKSGNDFNFLGAGSLYGSVGVKPLEVTFSEKVTLTYKDRKWDYDF